MYAAAQCQLMLVAVDIDLTVGTTCFE